MSNPIVYYSIYIEKENNESYALINSDRHEYGAISESHYDGSNDFGDFFDVFSMQLNHSILDLEKSSKIELTMNGTADYLFYAYPNKYGSDESDTIYDRLIAFVDTLNGRRITIKMMPEAKDQWETIYSGAVTRVEGSLSVGGGTNITLILNTKLAQLAKISSNGSWDEATNKWKNLFTTLANNTISADVLFTQAFSGTLLEDEKVEFINGKLAPLPSKLYASIIPNKSRLEVIREILIAYSRIIYQAQDGTIKVQPLFINDKADEWYNVDATYNPNGYWQSLNAVNNAAGLINRVDVIAGMPNNMISMYGNEQVDQEESQLFASAPYIKGNKVIASNPDAEGLDYTKVYRTSVNLYNSGSWVMPKQNLLSLSSIANDVILENVLLNKQFQYSVLWNKIKNDKGEGNIAKFYAQLFLAEMNVNNYNATVVYDYGKIQEDTNIEVLGKVVNIDNQPIIDYYEMLVVSHSLLISGEQGSNLIVDFAPLLSITGQWTEL